MADGCADARKHIFGMGNSLSRNRDHPFDERLAKDHGFINRFGGADIMDDHASVNGKPSRGNLAVKNGLDQQLFRALRIFYLQGTD